MQFNQKTFKDPKERCSCPCLLDVQFNEKAKDACSGFHFSTATLKYIADGACSHYVFVSNFQWKPFWACHPALSTEWLGWVTFSRELTGTSLFISLHLSLSLSLSLSFSLCSSTGVSRSEIGQQVLFQRNLSKILSPLLRDMQDWTMATRLKVTSPCNSSAIGFALKKNIVMALNHAQKLESHKHLVISMEGLLPKCLFHQSLFLKTTLVLQVLATQACGIKLAFCHVSATVYALCWWGPHRLKQRQPCLKFLKFVLYFIWERREENKMKKRKEEEELKRKAISRFIHPKRIVGLKPVVLCHLADEGQSRWPDTTSYVGLANLFVKF